MKETLHAALDAVTLVVAGTCGALLVTALLRAIILGV